MSLSIDWSLFSIGIVELFLTLIVGLLVVYIGYKAFTLFTKKINENEELKNNNIAVGIISASVIISMAILIKSAISPSITTLRLLIHEGITATNILLAVAFFLIFFVIAGIIAIVVILLATLIYNKLTKKIEEYTEIKNNNIAIAIVLAAVIIGISYIVQDGVSAIVSGIQPWPESIQNEDVPTKVGLILKNILNHIRNFII
jgi:uncharacterized membrane protein YjfL (UPF0719 family)